MLRRQQIPILLFALALAVPGCKKSKQEKPEELQKKQIENVIPQEYLNILKGLGMTVYEGINPPSVSGIYENNSLKLLKSNIPADAAGSTYGRERVAFTDFNNNDFSINLLVRSFVGNSETNGRGIVSGSGNNFTVYSVSTAAHGGYSIKLAILISATKDGESLKNLQYGFINVDDINNADGVLISEGRARVLFENDLISEPVTSLDFSSLVKALSPTGAVRGSLLGN